VPAHRKWTDEDLIRECPRAVSMTDLLQRLGIRSSEDQYVRVRGHCVRLNLSTAVIDERRKYSKMTDEDWLEKWLVAGARRIAGEHLKARLFRTRRLRNECYHCAVTVWFGRPAPLQLDHVNGDPRDNRIENLRILCGNCHALTETWCNKKRHLRGAVVAQPSVLAGPKRATVVTSKQLSRPRIWTDDQLKTVVPNAQAMSSVLTALGLAVRGREYALVRAHCERLGIAYAHLGVKKPTNAVSDEAWLTSNLVKGTKKISGHRLQQRLFRSGTFARMCMECGITKWQNKPAPLQIHHVNGDPTDNRIENLQVLCVNCHCLTETWGRRKLAA
jgi:5-methylcytosine-specific restriction endonuclease McrA